MKGKVITFNDIGRSVSHLHIQTIIFIRPI